jgi:hypothetical protein
MNGETQEIDRTVVHENSVSAETMQWTAAQGLGLARAVAALDVATGQLAFSSALFGPAIPLSLHRTHELAQKSNSGDIHKGL